MTQDPPPCRAGGFGVIGAAIMPGRNRPLNIILTSTLVVALAEIGDKTMLLAIVLAARFRRPLPIIFGIFGATIVNHALAAWAGSAIAGLLDGYWFRLAIAIGFLAMAAWTLVPDKFDGDEEGGETSRFGAFLTTLTSFFIVEIGDKTQIATIGLGAHYHSVELVAIGTTLGMMLANVPAVLLGDRITRLVPLHLVRLGAAAIFAIIGIWSLITLLA